MFLRDADSIYASSTFCLQYNNDCYKDKYFGHAIYFLY